MTVKHTIRYLGFHIGSRISDDVRFFRITNQLIFGTRFGFAVHDIDRTVYLMRKALLFFYNLNLSKVESLFMGSPINNTPINNHILKVFLDKKSYIIHGVSFTYLDWTHGLATNYRTVFLRFIGLIARKISFRKWNLIHRRRNRVNGNTSFLFISLFFKLFFILDEDWTLRSDSSALSDFKNNLYLWKTVLFLKHWRCFFFLPDVFLSSNTGSSFSGIREFSILKIPVISPVDSDGCSSDLSYFFPMTVVNTIGPFFLYSIFFNTIKKAQIDSKKY